MSEMNEIIRESLDGIKGFADSDAIIGKSINTSSGVTIIPVSKLTVGYLGGGVDYGTKKLSQSQNFGGGSGAGVSISPVAFLTVKGDTVNLIPLSEQRGNTDRMSSLIEKTPEIIKLFKNNMS